MRVFQIHNPIDYTKIPEEDVVLVLGFFDGVHRGHQAVIAEGRKQAKSHNLQLALMTFNQHPSIVFKKDDPKATTYLTTIPRKEEIMKNLGVDILYEVEFTSSFAKLTPQQFVDSFLVDLHAKIVVAGFDYTYGPHDIANMDHLPEYSKGNFDVISVQRQDFDGKKISSSRIRENLDSGNLDEVTTLLGYVYRTAGKVVHGEARGRTLGYPTANIETRSKVRLPKIGVYAVKIHVQGIVYLGMASVGHNVTFGDDRDLTVEVYILNFSEDIYGEQVVIEWFHLLRPEVKFSSAEELIEQLKTDEKNTESYFQNLEEKESF